MSVAARSRRRAMVSVAVGLAMGVAVTMGTIGFPAPSLAADDALAAHDYLLSCAGCHTPAGTGSRTVPTLHGVDRLLTHRDGRAYVLHVPGVASAPLSDARLAALLDWVFGHFGNDARPAFTAAEVAAARVAPFADPQAARAALE